MLPRIVLALKQLYQGLNPHTESVMKASQAKAKKKIYVRWRHNCVHLERGSAWNALDSETMRSGQIVLNSEACLFLVFNILGTTLLRQ